MHLIERLNLTPHPEGGHFREIFRSEFFTTIFFLLQQGERSVWHKISKDEIWHFYDGAPLNLFRLTTEGKLIQLQLSRKNPVEIVKAGDWQASESSGDFSLCGCTVAPPFELDDLTFPKPGSLECEFPADIELIRRLS